MSTNHNYDAKRAYHHIRHLAVPRLAGSEGEAKAQEYIIQQFTKFGLHLQRERFHFTKFPAEVLPRILCAFITPIVISVPWLGEQFPLPICLACVLALAIAIIFTRWQKWAERLYEVGRKHCSENIVATTGETQDSKIPTVILVAHYDSKSQVLPIAVRASAYGVSIFGLILLIIATVIQLIGFAGLPDAIAWAIAGITSFCLLLLQINLTQNQSPGGFDNASGVGVLLEVARTVTARGNKTPVTFLATGAEEYGMCGALRYIQKHADEHNRNRTYIINLDGLGIGNRVNLVTRYGIPPVCTTAKLRTWVQASGASLGVQIKERYLPVGVGLDSIPIASRGLETVTLTAGGASSVTLKVHSKQDRGELLSVESLQQVGELIVDVIERISQKGADE